MDHSKWFFGVSAFNSSPWRFRFYNLVHFRARLPIDARLAERDSLRGTGKYLVFTYCSVPSII